MSDLSIRDGALQEINTLKVLDVDHLCTLLAELTQTRGSVYNALDQLAHDGLINKEYLGRKLVIRSRRYLKRKRSIIDHDLGVNDGVVKFLVSCRHLGYETNKTPVYTGKKIPDDLWAFEKPDDDGDALWRIAWIEYQSERSPLSPRTWINRIDHMTSAVNALDAPGYVFWIIGEGKYYSRHYTLSLARMVHHGNLYFTTDRLMAEIGAHEFFTARIWHNSLFLDEGRISIFDER